MVGDEVGESAWYPDIKFGDHGSPPVSNEPKKLVYVTHLGRRDKSIKMIHLR